MSPAAARPVTARFKRRSFLPILLFFMHGCGCFYTADRPEVDPPAVSASSDNMAVIPSTVFVVPGAEFVMRARITDNNGGVYFEYPGLAWTVGSDLTKVGEGADSVTLQAANVTTTTVTTWVKAQAGTRSAEAKITILAPGAAGTLDSTRGDTRTAVVPDILLIDQLPAIDDSMIAFVGIGLLNNFAAGSGDVWRFATDQTFEMEPVTFQATKDIIDLRTGATATVLQPNPNKLRNASYTVWIATSAADAVDLAAEDINLAATLFWRERTGLALQGTIKTAQSSGPYALAEGTNPCVLVWVKLQDLGIPVDAPSFKPDSLNVVYVDDLQYPPEFPGENPISSLLTGYTCPIDADIGSVILIPQRWKGTSSLAHELGHAFGLQEPDGGHTNLIEGFSYTNLMWSREADATGFSRRLFTLAQAFRINLDDHSWHPYPPAIPLNCDVLKIDRRCPPLELDVR